MEHLTEHHHAFLIENKVIWVGVFDGHNEPFLDEIRIQLGADQVVCCCNVGYFTGVGATWDGTDFIPEVQEPSQEYLDWLANNPQ